MTYQLNLAHLYGDLMNPYGDIGNVLALQYYAKQMDTEINTHLVSLDDPFDDEKTDLVVFGGGQDFEQMIVSKDIQDKKESLTRYIESDGPMIAICGGYQLLGHYYEDAEGRHLEGIHALDHYTKKQDHNRFIGDVLIKNRETGQMYHGFENHQGMTFLGEGERPLGDVIEGHGNNGQDHTEGVIYKNVYGTYFHGPILTRNGEIAKRMLVAALKRRYPEADFSAQEALTIQETF